MKRERWRIPAAALVGLVLGWSPAQGARAETPGQQIKTTVDQVVKTLKDSRYQGEAGKKQRRQQLRRLIFPRFDFAEMAKRSLGSHWQRNRDREKEFVSAFSNFVESSYVRQIESYKDEKIVYSRERMDGDFAEVDTKVVTNHGDEVPILYRLHLRAGSWKVYDVVINHISLVNNYRSQFRRILATSSINDLIERLRDKGADRES